MERVKISVIVRGWRERRQSSEEGQGCESRLYDSLMDLTLD